MDRTRQGAPFTFSSEFSVHEPLARTMTKGDHPAPAKMTTQPIFSDAAAVAKALRGACKRPFWKRVPPKAALAVIAAAHDQGYEPEDFINIPNKHGKTAIMFASQLKASEALVQTLHEHGADPNQRGNRGHSAVVYAAFSGRVRTLEYLLSVGGFVKITVASGDSVLDVCSRRVPHSVRLLIKHLEQTQEGDWVDYSASAQAVALEQEHLATCKRCRIRAGLEEGPEKSKTKRLRDHRIKEELFEQLWHTDLLQLVQVIIEEFNKRDTRTAKVQQSEAVALKSNSDDDDDNDEDDDNGEDDGGTEETYGDTLESAVEDISLALCRCANTAFLQQGVGRRDFTKGIQDALEVILHANRCKGLELVLLAFEEDIIFRTFQIGDFPKKRSTQTRSLLVKALEKALRNCEGVDLGLSPQYLENLKDGSIAHLLVKGLQQSYGTSWAFDTGTVHAPSTSQESQPLHHRESYSKEAWLAQVDRLLDWCIEKGKLAEFRGLLLTTLSLLAHEECISAAKDMDEDLLDTESSKGEINRKGGFNNTTRASHRHADSLKCQDFSESVCGTCVQLLLLCKGVCVRSAQSHLPFLETFIKVELSSLPVTWLKHHVLDVCLPTLPCAEHMPVASGYESNSVVEKTESRECAQVSAEINTSCSQSSSVQSALEGVAAAKEDEKEEFPAAPKTIKEVIAELVEQAQMEPKNRPAIEQEPLTFSLSTIERILLSWEHELRGNQPKRLELLLLQETVAAERYFVAYDYACGTPELEAYLQQIGLTEEMAMVDYDRLATPKGDKAFLVLPEETAVVWVDDLQGLESVLSAAARMRDVNAPDTLVEIGFDAEWRAPEIACSVVQLAIGNSVFIVDSMKAMDAEDLYRSKLDEVLLELFTHKEHVVLAFSFSNDFPHLLPLSPTLEAHLHRADDLPSPLARLRVRDVQCELRLMLKQKNDPSLAKACFMVFGQPLNKTEQCSNWARRPLREKQLQYAAIDSWCLSHIAEFVDTQCVKQLIKKTFIFF